MKTIGIFYINVANIPPSMVDEHMKAFVNKTGQLDDIELFFIPVRQQETKIEFWGDTTKNCKPSKKLLLKLKEKYTIVLKQK